jgi:hypothetical protein
MPPLSTGIRISIENARRVHPGSFSADNYLKAEERTAEHGEGQGEDMTGIDIKTPAW